MKKKKDGKEVLKDFIQLLVGELLQESKQGIMNLGFPEVIASILYKRFGNKAPLIAKWVKDYNIYKATSRSGEVAKDWWRAAHRRFSRGLNLVDLVDLYEASKKSVEELNKIRKELELHVDPAKDVSLENERRVYKAEIESMLEREEMAFYSVLIRDIESGKIKDLKPYEDLSFEEAKKKYDEKRIFEDQTPVKAYSNGWRWINVGPRCELVGKKMSNCGSAGVMSMDPDKTIITLFDEHQNPHVVVTYSPNEKRISGDEGAGSTGVKPEYHKYVLDLAKTLEVQFDYNRSKSPELRLKGALGDAVQNIDRYFENSLNIIYLLKMRDGKIYYTNSYDFISKNDLDAFINAKRAEEGKAPVKLEKKHRTEKLGYALNRNNEVPGLISLYDFKKLYSEEK